MKVIFYGVRDVEKPIFEEVNKKFGYDMTLIPEYLTDEVTTRKAEGNEVVVLRGNCFATKERLDIYKEMGVKYVMTRTVGVNHIDVPYAKELGMKTAYVPFYSPNAIAELALSLAMTLLRNVAYTANKTKSRNFIVDKQMFSREVRNCTVGVVGLGRIGRNFAEKAHHLGFNVIGYDPYYKETEETKFIVPSTIDEIIEKSDIISIHCPLDGNRDLFDASAFKRMKNTAYIINVSRGGIINEKALDEALTNGEIAGAALDCVEFEPMMPGSPLFKHENLIVSPHMGWYSEEAASELKRKVAEESVRFAAGEAVHYPVNKLK